MRSTSPQIDRTSTPVTWRRLAEYGVPGAAVGIALATPLVYWSRLPEPMASHWGPSGMPDASSGRVFDVALMAAVTLVIGFGPLLAVRAPMTRFMSRVLIAVSWGGATLLGTLRVITVQANLDAPTWESAGSVTAWTMLAVAGGAVLMALAGAWVAGDRPDAPRDTRSVEAVTVAPGEAVVWASGTTGRLGAGVGVALLGVAALGAWLMPGPGRIIFTGTVTLAAVLMTMFGQCRVVIGPHGMTIRLGWLGWPRLHVPVAQIAEVTVEDIDPMSYGGWGLRRVHGATAVVIRAGQGIRVERSDGPALVVSVDDAVTGAGVLLAHVNAARA